jgi:glycosyltransferase involved in cell wall biosynthesis
MNPIVSVIVPCYNQGQYLTDALQSVNDQSFSNWECLIIDDGSIDNTAEIAKSFVTKDSRFIYLFKENGGVSSTRNVGIEKAKGQFIQFLDSDDILDNRKLEFSLYQMELHKNNNVKIVISNFRMITENSDVSLPPFCNLNAALFNVEGFLFQWNATFSIQIQCGFFDAKLFEGIRFSENLSAQEDWVVWVSLFKTGYHAVFIDEPLAYYRINPSSRMSTIGIDDNELKVLGIFKEILTYDEYYRLSMHLLTRYSESNKLFRNNLEVVKKSNAYQAGLMIRKIVYATGLIKPARTIFKFILRFKSS